MRRGEDQLLLLASDGLWDVFTNEEACALALEKFRGELARTGSGKQVRAAAGRRHSHAPRTERSARSGECVGG